MQLKSDTASCFGRTQAPRGWTRAPTSCTHSVYLMSRRLDQTGLSTARFDLRVTPEVDDRIRGLAWYCRESLAQLLRRLTERKRRQALDAGLKPPLSAPASADWLALQRGQRGATRRMIVRVTPEEKERIQGLAWYFEVGCSELFRRLAEELRSELVAQGKRPPLRVPDDRPVRGRDPRDQGSGT